MVDVGLTATAFVVDDLDEMPNDGRRYELIDGALIVSPAPLPRHQIVVTELMRLLLAACPPHLYVLTAPVDVRRGVGLSVQPDVLVARRDQIEVAGSGIDPPLLAIEVVSPSSRDIDLGLKWRTYARLEIRSYWVVDPGAPSVVVFILDGEQYVEVGRADGQESLRVTEPFPVTIVASSLLGGF